MVDDLTAVCGPSCTQCPAYNAKHGGDRAALELVAAQWTRAMGRAFVADDIVCDGCRVPGGRRSKYVATCEIRNCASGAGNITCAHCAECPCEKIVSPQAREALAILKKTLRSD